MGRTSAAYAAKEYTDGLAMVKFLEQEKIKLAKLK